MWVKIKITTSLFFWCCNKWPDHRLWSGQLNVCRKKKSFWKYSSLRLSNMWVDRKRDRKQLLTNILLNKYRERPCTETGCCLMCHRSCWDSTSLLFFLSSLQLKRIMMQLSLRRHFKLIANLYIIFKQKFVLQLCKRHRFSFTDSNCTFIWPQVKMFPF